MNREFEFRKAAGQFRLLAKRLDKLAVSVAWDGLEDFQPVLDQIIRDTEAVLQFLKQTVSSEEEVEA